jgi:hypothetical protein
VIAGASLNRPEARRAGRWSSGSFVLTIISLKARKRSESVKKPGAVPSHRWVLKIGLILLLVGGYPWIYTPFSFGHDNEEAWGMLGTIIFLLVGMPGVAVTAIGSSLVRKHRRSRLHESTLDES